MTTQALTMLYSKMPPHDGQNCYIGLVVWRQILVILRCLLLIVSPVSAFITVFDCMSVVVVAARVDPSIP